MRLESHYFLRKVDELGRIVLPIEIRKEIEVKEAETLKVFIDKGRIILEKIKIGV